MSLDPAGRAPRAPRFATAQTAIKKQEKDVKRARRRATALWRQDAKRMTPASIIAAGAKPLRILQEILGHADVIALDTAGQGPRNVHMLVTLPARLLDQATALAAIDEDDEDTDGGEDDQDLEPSLAGCTYGGDMELDEADSEPSLGSLDAQMNQERWCAGDRLDRERGPGVGDCDDDEENGDREPGEDDEPEHIEPNLSPCGFSTVGSSQNYGAIDGEEDGYGKSDPRDDAIRDMLRAERRAGCGLAKTPHQPTPGLDRHLVDIVPELYLPTGNRPGGLVEMKNQTTGETGVWKLLTRDGEAR